MVKLDAFFPEVQKRIEPEKHLKKLNENNIQGMFLINMGFFMFQHGVCDPVLLIFCFIQEYIIQKSMRYQIFPEQYKNVFPVTMIFILTYIIENRIQIFKKRPKTIVKVSLCL